MLATNQAILDANVLMKVVISYQPSSAEDCTARLPQIGFTFSYHSVKLKHKKIIKHTKTKYTPNK